MPQDRVYTVRDADFDRPADRAAIVELLSEYAGDPISAGGAQMTDFARENVADALREHPTAVVLLAETAGSPVGLAVGYTLLGTFAAKPQFNLHDLVVRSDYRGRGVGGALLDAIEARARRLDCRCVTLEVLGTNIGAQRLYRRHGFAGGRSIDPPESPLFWKKPLE